ncbi:DivIVA domain-containing protein [Nonomuraea angiospora]|uniref:DivIVA domain-containing protein n=1 Tax=Nonomuraea angiospora TaxID=46172 RepID=UPI0036B0D7CB
MDGVARTTPAALSSHGYEPTAKGFTVTMHAEHDEHDHGPHLPHSHAAADSATSPSLQAVMSGQLALLTAAAVHHQVFTVVRLRGGYDLAEVDAFLSRVETTLSLLWGDNAQLRERLAANAVAPSDASAGAEVLAAAHRSAEKTITAAQHEARQILAAAHAEAEQRHREAAAAADSLTQAARQAIDEQIDQLVVAVTDQSRHLQHTLHGRLAELRAVLDDLTTPSHGVHEASPAPARPATAPPRTPSAPDSLLSP